MFEQLHGNKITALYCRLSRDDGYSDDSCSIDSQKAMLQEHAANLGLINCEFFVDDGFSGTNFDRPDFTRMISMCEDNLIGTLMVKDLSRLGREYLRTGYYTEIFFPLHDVRFIAINDGVDSANGDNEFAPFKNIINEWYAKDISMKIKTSRQARAKRGEYVNGTPPYGYMRDPNKRNHLIPDENTAPYVRLMFRLALEGATNYRIAVVLRNEKAPKPSAYIRDSDGGFHLSEKVEYPYDWNAKTVSDIITNVTYIGHLYYNMTTHRSFKDRTKVYVPEEQWIKCEYNHEPLVGEDIFNKVQEIAGTWHRVVSKYPELNLYGSLCRCADCGYIMWFARRGNNYKSVGNYTCGRTKLRHPNRACTAHYIKIEELNSIVISQVQNLIAEVISDRNDFIKRLGKSLDKDLEKRTAKSRKELDKCSTRIEELNILIMKVYEDCVFKKITSDVYNRISGGYEKELAKLTEKASALRKSLVTSRASDDDISRFADLIEEHADMEQMTVEIAHKLIDHIIVYEKDSVKGRSRNRIDVYYQFIGMIPERR